ncbi:MAG: hypothetical protein ACREJU_07975 [Nitrospiraceae bacterium]
MLFRPPLFLLTGLLWLLLSALLGLVLFLGTIRGNLLPPTLRLVHVHGALIGGVAQIIFGAMLAFVPPLLLSGRNRPESHPVQYALINIGTIAALIGFALRDHRAVGVAGLLIIVAFLSLFADAVKQARSSLVSPPLNLWFYGVAFLALLCGLGLGDAMAFHVIPHTMVAPARLSHIHLNLLGFVTLTIIGTMHNLFPTVLNTRLHSARLARLAFFFLPLGILLLVTGFMLTAFSIQIGAGVVILSGIGLYATNIVRTWIDAGRPLTAASDHFLMATFFLVLVVPAGILVAVNLLWDPPRVPFGTLHVVAYTHLALVGFVLHTIFGALSHLLPISLALSRVSSNKKRRPYLEQLTMIAERWRGLQVGALSLGTIGLVLVAVLVWPLSLGSVIVQTASWLSAGLLLVGVGIFAAKVGWLLVSRPQNDRPA